MDLRYVNPYYRRKPVSKAVRSRTASLIAYEDFIPPVCDRTAEDVELAQELTKKGYRNLTEEEKVLWDSGLKGCQNVTDWNRVETDCRILSNVFELGLVTKTWGYDAVTIPAADYERIRANVTELREAYIVHVTTPQVPGRPFNSYQKINDIEQILSDLYDIVNSNFYYYCGTDIYTGDVIGGLL